MRGSSDESNESVQEPPLSYVAVAVSLAMPSVALAVHEVLLRLRGVATVAVVG